MNIRNFICAALQSMVYVAGGDDFTTLSPNSRLETFEIDTRRRQLALNGGERSNARD